MSNEQCPFCNRNLCDGQPTVELREKGANTLNQVAGDTITFVVGQKVHVDCRRNFCRDAGGKDRIDQLPNKSSVAVKRRSTHPPFCWKEHCLFCGEPSNKKRKGSDTIPVRTADFQTTITEICRQRNDEWASTVLGRVEYARDLHAADAVYHNQCSVNFRTGKEIPKQFISPSQSNNEDQESRIKNVGRPQNSAKVRAFQKAVKYLEDNDEEQVTVNQLCDLMKTYLEAPEDEPYSTVYMKEQLQEYFGDQIVITTIKNKANVVTLRKTAASIINEFYQNPKQSDAEAEKTKIISTAAQLLKSEIKNLQAAPDHYPNSDEFVSTEMALLYVPNLLERFLRTLFVGKDLDLKVASIAQAIMQATRPRGLLAPLQLGLGVHMHHHFSSRFLIDTLNSMGFCSSYSAVQNFEKCAAVTHGVDIPDYEEDSFIQYIADNVDHNLRTLDGHGTFHGMGMIAKITPSTKVNRPILKRSVTSGDIVAASKLTIRHYNGPNGDEDPSLVYGELSNLKAHDSFANLDLLFKLTQPLAGSPRPSWPGTMQLIFKGNHPARASVQFLPMIDIDPGNLTCIYSTLSFIVDQANRYGITPIITFDQPLWWKALMIILNEPKESGMKSIVLRLRGLHIQMSFLGCIGHIMAGSGLADVLELIYAKNAVVHMLSGKAIARAVQDGLHVVRRSDRYWGGLSTDLVIEQVLMRSVKTTGGLTRGKGMSETQQLVWLLSMPSCAEINGAMQTLTGESYATSEQHKDCGEARQQRDYADLKKVTSYLNE
jgi:hypothetical protein